MSSFIQICFRLFFVSFAILIGGNVAYAQQLEEIIVTAQKREQNLQDVPISITAVSGDYLSANAIDKMEVLAQMLPTFHVSEAYGGDIVVLRGQGPGNNDGFEQSVGTVVDGFFFGHSRYGRVQFLDIDRLELLKGPQGAIIGKNTTAGALNITTKLPTDEFEAYLTLDEEFEGAEGEAYEGAISGPLFGDNVKARLAMRYENKDGYLKNTATGNDDQSRDDIMGRGSLLWEPSEDFSILAQYSFSEIDRTGRHLQISSCSPFGVTTLAALMLATPENCVLDDTRTVTDTRNGVPGNEFQKTNVDIFGLTLTKELDNVTLTSLTGWAEYQYEDIGNTSYTNTEATFFGDIKGDHGQFSQEFRVTSNEAHDIGGMRIDYIGGVYYAEQNLDTVLRLVPKAFNASRVTNTFQNGKTAAVFGQLEWHATDTLDVAFEARYTFEEKAARTIQGTTALFTYGPIIAPPVACGMANPAGVCNTHYVSDSLQEADLSPGVTVTWHPTEDWMLYGSYKEGFKGSGFDHSLNGTQAQASDGRFKFSDEKVASGEVGGKLAFADGAARVNVSLFHNDYSDLQVSTLISTATFAVGNAASATTQGIEADLQWRLSEGLTVTVGGALLDASYDSYANAACSTPQLNAGTCSAAGTQDLSGRDMEYAADHYYNTSAEYVWPLDGGMSLTSYVTIYGEGEKFLAGDLDPNTLQDSFTKVDARLTLSGADNNWSVSLIGRNLGDETTSGFANDISQLSQITLGGSGGSYFAMTDPPRSLVLQATKRF